MRVQLSKEVLNDQKFFRALDDLLGVFESDQHILDMANEDDFENCLWSEGSGRSEKRAREFLQKAYVSSSNKKKIKRDEPHQLLVVVVRVSSELDIGEETQGVVSLSPQEARDYLKEPLRILVEDEISDGAFVTMLMQRFASTSARQLFKRKDCVCFEHGGGGGGVKKKLNRLAEAEPKRWPPRYMVMIDSDRLFPWKNESELPSGAQDILKICRKTKVQCHVLHHREIENYIPREVLKAYFWKKPHLGQHDALARMTPAQYAHFDLKNGFKAPQNQDPAYLEQYATLSAEERLNLNDGFRQDLYKLFIDAKVAPLLSKERLSENAGQNHEGMCELEELAHTICRLL